jgi:hypothetical protein
LRTGKETTVTANSIRPPQSEFDPSDPLSSFLDVLRRVALHPVDFFSGIPRRAGLVNPFLFALICIIIGAVLNAVVGLIGVQSAQSSAGLIEPLGLRSQSLAGFVASIVILVIIGIVSLPIVAALYQLAVRIAVGAENAGFSATFRVVAYASVVNLVSWIPILGLLLSLYGLYLQVVGLREVHQTTTGRAIGVLLVFLGIAILLGIVIGIVVAAILIAQSAL